MDYDISLPDGSTYRIVPVQQGIEVIRTWSEHPWPMTTTQAFALRDHFGWTSFPARENIFTTNHNTRDYDASFTTIDDATVSSFNLTLTSFAPEELDPITQPAAQAAYNAYTTALTKLYGPGSSETSQGVTSTTWHLPNGASIDVGTIGSLVASTIESPEANEDAAGEERYFDEYMTEEEEAREVSLRYPDYQRRQQRDSRQP